MPEADCPCGSGRSLTVCCGPYIAGSEAAPTAQALMRSRYTAYALGRTDYLLYTWHPATAPKTLELEPTQKWIGLKVNDVVDGGPEDDSGEVAFVARYKIAGSGHRLEERSEFARLGGRWVYVGGIVSTR